MHVWEKKWSMAVPSPLSSAQQQMGRGCGLVGWVTRIMNLPVVLFNTKTENENTNNKKQSGMGFFIRTANTSNRETNWFYTWCVWHLSQQSFFTFWWRGSLKNKGKACSFSFLFFTGLNDSKRLIFLSRSRVEMWIPFILVWILAASRTNTIYLYNPISTPPCS